MTLHEEKHIKESEATDMIGINGKKTGQDRTSEDTFKEIATAVSMMDAASKGVDIMNDLMHMKPYAYSEEDGEKWSEFIHTTAVSMGAILLRSQVMCARLKEDVGAADPKETRSVIMHGALAEPKITAALFAVEDMMGITHCMDLPPEVMDAFEGTATAKVCDLGEDPTEKVTESLMDLLRQAATGEHPIKDDGDGDEEYRIQE